MFKECGGIVKTWEAAVRKSQNVARKRANSIFTAMSVAPADDEPGPGELYPSERILTNGDFYTGQWMDNTPHGHGKYLWKDGCMYVGEWHNGKTLGKGKFIWPSGATYEGDFKSGYMDGKGTFTGSSGDTYRGCWVMNLKHGQGTQIYANGDYYEGEWRRGSQDGHGKYQWKNQAHYIGQWRNGMINGTGTMIWSNGNRYDGSWEDGFPKGNGTFRWSDGNFYVGVWSKDPKEQIGTYYTSSSSGSNLAWDPQEVFSVYLNDCIICTSERILLYPSQKVIYLSGLEGELLQKQSMCKKVYDGNRRLRRTSVDSKISNSSFESTHDSPSERSLGNGIDVGSLRLEDLEIKGRKRPNLRIQPGKRPGVTISRGHRNYELMLNLQLGIRY